jgi:hypothetical protein
MARERAMSRLQVEPEAVVAGAGNGKRVLPARQSRSDRGATRMTRQGARAVLRAFP